MSGAMRARVEAAQAEVGAPASRADVFPHQFSGGMRQRAMIAAVIALAPRLLLADEPTTALDTLTQAEATALLTRLTRERGTAVLLISHDLGLVARHADRVHVLERGRLVEAGPMRETLAGPRHPDTRRLLDAAPALSVRAAEAAEADAGAAEAAEAERRAPAGAVAQDLR